MLLRITSGFSFPSFIMITLRSTGNKHFKESIGLADLLATSENSPTLIQLKEYMKHRHQFRDKLIYL